MRKTPLVPIALALMAGILTAHHIAALPTVALLYVMGLTAIVCGLLMVLRRKAVIPLLLFVMATGGMLDRINDPLFAPNDWRRMEQPNVHMLVRLVDTPSPREKSYRTMAEVISIDQSAKHGSIRLYLKKDSTAATLRYGDSLLLHGYPDVERGYLYVTSDHYLIVGRDSTSLRARCERLRMRLLHRMQQGPLDRRHAGMAEALTLGWRADIDPETQASFRDAGIAHLLAVSGLHVGLVAALVGAALFWVNKERRGRIIRGCIQLAAVWAFTLFSGMSPSAMRAALMFSMFIVNYIFKRRTSSFNLLAACALLTLCAQPMLLFNIGWQLSYAAVAGILLAIPVIQIFRNRLWQTAIASIAATLATMPIAIATFHRLPIYFLIANIVIIPFAGTILGLSLCYIAFPCPFFATPLDCILTASEALTQWVASLPGAVIEF